MAYDIRPIHAEQGRIVREFFVDTADDNYITARWCFVERLHIDSFWLSVHALEKYMKAILLLNGESSKGYSHDIVALYARIKCLASDLLPSSLKKPDDLDTDRWSTETPEAFIQRLRDNGNPDNRYQIFGFYRRSEDLFKLDMLVFALRRLCVPLDAYYLGKQRKNKVNFTHRDILIRQPEKWSVSRLCKLEKTAAGERGERLREVFLNLNLPFAPKDFSHSPLQSGMAAHNSILVRSILRPLERASGSQAAEVSAEVCDWVIKNIQLPKDVKRQLCDAVANQKTMD